MKDKNEINVLDELSKRACMVMDEIHFILPKVNDDNLKQELNTQYEKYKSIHNKICELYSEYRKKKKLIQ